MQRLLKNAARWLRLHGGRPAHALARIGIHAWRCFWSLAGLAVWPLPVVRAVFLGRSVPKRLLAVWDCAAQPYAIGDMLCFHAGALAACEDFGASKVDLCVLSDARAFKVGSSAAEINADNRYLYTLALARLAAVNPRFGSLIYLDSRDEFDIFLARNATRYRLWPPFGAIVGREYVYHRTLGELADRYRHSGKPPRLASTPTAKRWAQDFFEKHASGHVPVIVQFRQNKLSDGHRNSNTDAWLTFLRRCGDRAPAPVKFIVISGSGEVAPGFRDLPNVVIVKDHHTTVEQDMALIECGAFYLATASGPAIMAFCSEVPYSILNWPLDVEMSPEMYPGLERVGDHLRWVWGGAKQRLVPRNESPEALMDEFELQLSALEKGAWPRGSSKTSCADDPKLRLW